MLIEWCGKFDCNANVLRARISSSIYPPAQEKNIVMGFGPRRPSIDADNTVSEPKIIYEDEWLLVVSKAAGLVVHVNPGDRDNEGALRRPNLQSILEKKFQRRLTLFHRLDRGTSGLLIFGKDHRINQTMTEAFVKHRVRKSYFAIVKGRWSPNWNKVENFLAKAESGRHFENRSAPPGQAARTTFRLLSATDEKSWLEAMPKTGRTHQIRLHCLANGCPILGDTVYGLEARAAQATQSTHLLPAIALHAYRLDFRHPATNVPLRLFDTPPAFWHNEWLKDLDDGTRLKRLLHDRNSPLVKA